jgi:vacuolar-type H+-ATPase subunit C/Vma6
VVFEIMIVKALTNFAGIITMVKGQELEILNKEVLDDLLKAKFVEEVKGKKKVKADGN